MKNQKPPNRRDAYRQSFLLFFLPFIEPVTRWLERTDIRRKQLSQLPWGVIIVLVAVALGSAGWSVLRTGDWPGLWLNFGTEMVGAIVTYLLLEIVIGTRQKKELLIAQLTSKSLDVATNAIEEIIRNDWHRDGSLSNVRLYQANLPGVELPITNFENSELTEANLQGARLYSANLKWAMLQRANLTNASLDFADLSSADLTGATLTGASCFHTSFAGAHMGTANLRHASLNECDLQDANLFGADLRGAKLFSARLERTSLTQAQYNSQTSFPSGFNPDDAKMIQVERPEDLIAYG